MSDASSVDQVDRLLRQLGEAFLSDLLEQCDLAESDLFVLEQHYDPVVFNRLFGLVHSIKGSGGTHGFAIITSIGHQFESVLIDWQQLPSQKTWAVLLGFVDLLRQAADVLTQGADVALLKQQLETLRSNSGQLSRRVMLVESSRIMRQLCQQVLSDFSLQVDTFEDGLTALSELLHTRYDCLIIGRQLTGLNGSAVVSALREADTVNTEIPVLMISTDQRQPAAHLKILRLLPRTPALSDVLLIEIEKLINTRPLLEDDSLG